MADDTDTQVAQAQAPPPDLSGLSPDMLSQALKTLMAVPPPVTVDQTPANRKLDLAHRRGAWRWWAGRGGVVARAKGDGGQSGAARSRHQVDVGLALRARPGRCSPTPARVCSAPNSPTQGREQQAAGDAAPRSRGISKNSSR